MAARRPRVAPDQEISGGDPATAARTGGATSGDTVTVACKLPHGLILRVFDMVEATEAAAGGGLRTITRAQARPEEIVLNGFANEVNKSPKTLTYGNFGMTHNVDRDFFERWLEENATAKVVTNGLIFALPDHEDAQHEAKDREELRSGFEALDPESTTRIGPFNVTQTDLR